jgi:sugar lactone lactonase YvrE
MLRRTLLLSTVSIIPALGQPPRRVVTIAGTGTPGYSGDGGPAVEAEINNPYGLNLGPDGSLYFCEVDNHCVRKLHFRTRELSTVAGNLRTGYSGDGHLATEAAMNQPYEVEFDAAGNMFVVEMQNHVVRRVDAKTQIITTVAGTGTPGFSGDGGPAVKAQLRQPHSIAFDAQGRLLICDIGNQRVRRVDLKTGLIESWLGGSGNRPISDGAPLAGTLLNGPRAIELADDGSFFLVLREGNSVYRIEPKTQRFILIAGTGEKGYSGDGGPARKAKLSGPKGIAHGTDGIVYLADTESHTIRRVDTRSGIITTVLGTGERGDGPDGDPLRCKLARPHGVSRGPRGGLLVADSENHRIRAIR